VLLILLPNYSNSFLDSTFSLDLSSAIFIFSASSTNFSISSLDNLPLSLSILMLLEDLPVFSKADTFKTPFSSKSKVTSI